MTWKEQIEGLRRVIELTDDEILVEHYEYVIKLWEEVGQLAALRDFDITDTKYEN